VAESEGEGVGDIRFAASPGALQQRGEIKWGPHSGGGRRSSPGAGSAVQSARRGIHAQLAVDGETALEVIAADSIDAIILDVMLPGGMDFRRGGATGATEFVPILMLTARGVRRMYSTDSVRERTTTFPSRLISLSRWRVLMVAPCRMAWLKPGGAPAPSSHRAVLSRFLPSPLPGAPFISLHLSSTTPSKNVRLTLMECDLLRYLVLNQGRIISRKELLEQVCGCTRIRITRIDNFMVRLRRYIEDNPAEPVFLETVRGVGYRFLPAWLVDRLIARRNTFSPLPVLDGRGRLPDSSMLSLLWVRRQSRYIFPRRKISLGCYARRLLTMRTPSLLKFRRCARRDRAGLTTIVALSPKKSPEGTAELSPGRKSWVGLNGYIESR